MNVQNEYFRGFACIELIHLRLDPMKLIEESKVKAVTRSCKRSGCRNADIEHAVPILIDQKTLSTALANVNLSPSELNKVRKEVPILRFPATERFSIMYGDHRLHAAERSLPASKCWWIVALFDPGW